LDQKNIFGLERDNQKTRNELLCLYSGKNSRNCKREKTSSSKIKIFQMLPTKMLAAQTLKMWLPFLRRRRKTKGSKYQAKTKIKFLHGIVHLFLLFVKHCFAITTKFAFLNILLKKNCSFFAFCHRFNSFTKEYSMLKIVILKP